MAALSAFGHRASVDDTLRPRTVGRWIALGAVLVGLAVSLLPMTPSGSAIDCGNAFDAVSYKVGPNDGVAPTVGQLCHPLGTGRFAEIAIFLAVGLAVSVVAGLLVRRANG